MNEKELREHLRELCNAEGGVKPWSEKQRPKISHSYVGTFLRGERPAGKKILKALGLKKVIVYCEKHLKVIMKFENVQRTGD
jgi:hypothetical protein